MERSTTRWTWAAVIGLSMLAAFMGLAAVAGPARASEVDVLIEKLAQKGLLTRLEAETMRGDVEMAEKASYVKHREETNPWLADLTAKGDVRLRYETFSREAGDANDRSRYRARVRWGLEKKFADEWRAGFRIATGASNEATSTNQTFTDEFNLKSIFLDQAYAIWAPTARVKEWMPAVNLVEIGAGKVANPYEKWGTTIIWDGDVTPEGIYEKIDLRLAKYDVEAFWDLHFLAGQWIVDEDSDFSPGDQEMFSYGIGTTYQWAKDRYWNFFTAYYDWQDYIAFGKGGNSALGNALGGNDRELDDLKILNFYTSVNFPVRTDWFGTQNLNLFGDIAINTAAEEPVSSDGIDFTDENLRNHPRPDEDFAFSVGSVFGKAKDKGTWAAGYEYYYVEANAVNGVFMESDLGLGFANNKGHKLSYKYMVVNNLELNLTLWLVEHINPTRVDYFSSGDLDVFGDDKQIIRTQADLVYKF